MISAWGGKLDDAAAKNLKYISEQVTPVLNEVSLKLLQERPANPEKYLLEHFQRRVGGPVLSSFAAGFAPSDTPPGAEDLLAAMGVACPSSEGEGADVKEVLATPHHPAGRVEKSPIFQQIAFDSSKHRDMEDDVHNIIAAFESPYNLLDKFQINVSTLDAWIKAISLEYVANNPYHNWSRAFDAFQFAVLSLTIGGIGAFLSLMDILVILCASLVSDLAHPGLSNSYLVNTRDKIAICYNDRSPLESMHASKCFEKLSRPGLNFLDKMEGAAFKVFKAGVVAALECTDQGCHFQLLDRLAARFPVTGGCQRQPQDLDEHDRRLLAQAVVYNATLARCYRPWDVHKHAVLCLEQEFFIQGDLERESGMPVTPLMDRSKDSLAACQDFFLLRVVSPLLDICSQFYSTNVASQLHANLDANSRRWAELLKGHGTLSAAKLIHHERGGGDGVDDEDPEHEF